MLTLSDAAKVRLRAMNRAAAPGRPNSVPVVQRLVAGHYGRLQFVDDASGDWTGDTVFEDADGVLLVIETALYTRLEDITLDCETYQGTSLLCFRKPEAPD